MRRGLEAITRGTTVLLVAMGAGAAACRLAVPPLALLTGRLIGDGPGGPDAVTFEAALTGLSAVVLLGCVLWLALAAALTVTAYVARELVPGSRWTPVLGRAVDRGCPAALARLVAGALGVAVTLGVTGPALAAPVPVDPLPVDRSAARAHPVAAPAGTGLGRLSGLALPDRLTGAAPTRQALHRAPRTGPSESAGPPDAAVEVRAGQSLWSIAEGLLPAAATDADISRAWHRLHRANTSAIGVDPDLILPGTRLVVPSLVAAPTREEAP